MRHPFGRVAGRSLLEHAVDLFEREALGLGDEEVGVDEAADAEGAPDEEDFGAQVAFVCVDHVGGDDCDDLWWRRTLVFISGLFLDEGERTQFHSQLLAVDSATPRERIGSGKISPITTQAPGPQVEAKKKI